MLPFGFSLYKLILWPLKSGATMTPLRFFGMCDPDRISRPQSLGWPGLSPSSLRLAPGE